MKMHQNDVAGILCFFDDLARLCSESVTNNLSNKSVKEVQHCHPASAFQFNAGDVIHIYANNTTMKTIKQIDGCEGLHTAEEFYRQATNF